MLANISSKIILAVIAIILVYTFAPLVKTFIDDIFFKKPKKKSMSRTEFDEMVNRKAEQFSGKSRREDFIGSSKEQRRDELDSLNDIGFFKDEKEYENFKDLKKELNWGTGDQIFEIKERLKRLGIELEDSTITKTIKVLLKKKPLLASLNKGETQILDFHQLVILNISLSQLLIEKDMSAFKEYRQEYKELTFILHLALDTNQQEVLINDYLNESEIELTDLPLTNKKFNTLKKLKSEVDHSLNIFEPLIKRDEKYFLKKFNNVRGEELKIKSLYKKLVQLHHPDKWNYFEKSELLTSRLNYNFNNLRSAYEKVLES